MSRRGIALASTILLAGAGLCAVVAPASADTVICEAFGTTTIQGRYVVMNNLWGASTPQCINVTDTGFSVTSAGHNKATNGAPASYPAVYYGCHYGNCSPGTILPALASSDAVKNLQTSVSLTYPSDGTWDAAYDIWYDPTPRTDGQNTGAEIMVWLNHQGAIQPIGAPVGTATIAGQTWEVWHGDGGGWSVISYVQQGTGIPSISFAPNDFLTDSAARGFAQTSWYLTSLQAGFEPWIGGAGLAVTSFSVS